MAQKDEGIGRRVTFFVCACLSLSELPGCRAAPSAPTPAGSHDADRTLAREVATEPADAAYAGRTPAALCGASKENLGALRLRAYTNGPRAALAALLEGGSSVSFKDATGDTVAVKNIARGGACAPPPVDTLRASYDVARKAFVAQPALRKRAGVPLPLHVGVGCEENGRLLLTMSASFGIFDHVDATYLVSTTSAEMVGPYETFAHADVDGDGKLDLVWAVPELPRAKPIPKLRAEVRLGAAGHRRVPTPASWYEPESEENSHGAAPEQPTGFAFLVVNDDLSSGHKIVQRRYAFRDGHLVETARLEDAFETRVTQLQQRIAAIAELGSCAGAAPEDARCAALVDGAVAKLVKAGMTSEEARAEAQLQVGWRPCEK